jgi:UDP-N-acetylmuramoylalanine--D-glutamate ligase
MLQPKPKYRDYTSKAEPIQGIVSPMAKIAIVGWGLEAQSAFKHFGPANDYLIVNESRRDDFPPESNRLKLRFLEQEAPIGIPGQIKDLSYLEGLDGYDKIVYQPTAYFNLKQVYGDNADFWAKATTVYDIFFAEVKTKNIIGVTGSKGKGTTSTLIAKMLEAAGKAVHLGGNIGTPILDLLPEIKSEDWVIWELANFQLKAASSSPHIAVCLMITPEHLDWHPNFDDYLEAKANIFKHQSPEDIAIYYAQNQYAAKIAGSSKGRKIPYFQKPGAYARGDGMIVVGEEEIEIIKTSELKLLGEHNWQNVCAAITTVWQITQDVAAMRQVLTTFSGLEHRLEFVRELNGIKYYDDSFATTPDSAIVALQALKQPLVLITGGWDKGLDMSGFMPQIAQADRVRHAILIGQIAPQMSQRLKEKAFTAVTEDLTDMPAIVAEARSKARSGDVVLLSCGTSSFGLFKDYKDRGNQFKAAVLALD